MEDSNILQIVENNRHALNGIVNVTVKQDGQYILFGHGKIRILIITTLAYIIIAFSLLLLWVSISDNRLLIPIWPVIIILCIYIVRIETRIIAIDLKKRNVSIWGRWQRKYTYDWSSYQGYETIYSVKDFPEDFYIIFKDGGKNRKIKLANLSLALRQYNPTHYEAFLAVWNSIEGEMESYN